VARIIEGKAIAQQVRTEVAAGVAEFVATHGRAPGLHVVLCSDDPASATYVRNKEKAASEVGMAGQGFRLPQTTTQAELLATVQRLNQDPLVDGILVQLPLYPGLDSASVIAAIDPGKDVDGLHVQNAGKLWSGQPGLVPCTPRGCMRLLREAGAAFKGSRAIVVGRSNLVGKPVAALLLAEHCTVTLAHSRTQDLPARCREADILVAAVGRARMIQRSWVQPGAIVIDVGMNRDAAGKLCGDVDFADVKDVAAAITPVPGGVGPMTIAMLLDNTLQAARAREAAR
jgi:methylenetetrahydrofolate dehydrogenase (NADP+) / methenyltetrahydrofolate cyclohydrolase